MTENRIPRTWIAAILAGKPVHGNVPCAATDLIDCAQQEGVAALLADALVKAESNIDLQLKQSFQDAARVAAAYELSRFAETRTVLRVLADGGVRALLLKGSALAYWLYREPAHRSRCDVDILVDGKSQAELAVSLLESVGYRLVAPPVRQVAGFETALERNTASGASHQIDLHWRLMNHAELTQGFSFFKELWANSIPIERLGGNAQGLTRAYALAHALLHRVANFPSGKQDRLIWLYDMHLLAGGCSVEDWREFLRLCREKAIAMPCLDGLQASRIAFGTAIPMDIETTLQEMSGRETWRMGEMLDQGAMDRAHLAALSWSEKAGWLWRKLFPSPTFMRYRYGAEGAGGLAQAYLARWWTGVKRGFGS